MASRDPSPTQTFARTALAFIAALKQDTPLSAADLYQAIIALQAAALALPGDFYDFEAPSKPDYMTAYNARREALARRLPKGLGYYHTCHNPLDVSAAPEMAIGDAIDDLADIWGDLETGLTVFNFQGPQAAAWHWTWHFKHHWRSHAMGLLSALAPLLDEEP